MAFEKLIKGKVKDFMRISIPYVSSRDTLAEVIKQMVKNESGAVFVKDGDNIVGVITERDVITSLSRGKDIGEMTADYSMMACSISGATPCIRIDERSKILDVFKVMDTTDVGIDHLLVFGKGGVVGMISFWDVLKALQVGL